jgi:phosphoribosylcarboxyaminoimidazole (NCAIR) mutase
VGAGGEVDESSSAHRAADEACALATETVEQAVQIVVVGEGAIATMADLPKPLL